MTLTLTIATPSELALDGAEVTLVRAADDSGSFGIMAGHADLLTMMRQTILRWRLPDGSRHYCAVQGALLLASGGDVRVSAREARLGGDLDKLEQEIAISRQQHEEATKEERVASARLHAQAVRALDRPSAGQCRTAEVRRMNADSPPPLDRLADAAREAKRLVQTGERMPEPSLASRLAQVGVLGWMIVIPALIGVVIGRWIDARTGGGIMVAAALMLLGVCLGFWSAWHWMHRP